MNVPKLRFPEFNEKWENPTLDRLVERVTRKNKNLESELPLTISADKGLVDQITYFNKNVSGKDLSGYYLLKKGEFAYNKSYSNGYPWGAIKQLENYSQGLLSTLYICFKAINVDDVFLKHYFETTHWHKEVSMIAAEGARNHGLLNIPVNEFFKIKLSVPNNNEQKKIGDLFEKLNKKIQLQQEKMDLLKEQKKGYMQKIFTQELRFKDENNIEFPEWNSKSIKSIAEIIGGGTPNTQDPSLWNGNIPWISSSDILQDNYYDINISRYITESAIKNSATHLIPSNSIAIVSRVGLGKVAYITKEYCTSQDFQNLINFKENPIFLIHAIALELKRIIAMSQGTSIKGITKKELENIHIYLPCIEEQNKIGDFLKAFDIKILNEEEKIELLKSKKKYFMQQMFI